MEMPLGALLSTDLFGETVPERKATPLAQFGDYSGSSLTALQDATPLMGFGGAGSRNMAGAAGGALGIRPF